MSAPKSKRIPGSVLRWAWEFVKDYNATQATQRVRPHITHNSARQIGYRILHSEEGRRAIAAVEDELLEQSKVRVHKLLEEIGLVAHSSIDHFALDDEGRVQLAENAPPNALRAVASMKRKRRTYTRDDVETTEVETEIRLWNKPEALRLGMQHLGQLTEKHEHTGKDGAPLEVHVIYDDPTPNTEGEL